MVYKRFVSKLIIDKKRSKRKAVPELTRDKFITSDNASLDLIQNDPWEIKVIVVGIPTFLSTVSEFKDLCLLLEDHNIKFFSANFREHGWNGNCVAINLGTIMEDIKELLRQIRIYYPNKKIFLLGQGLGAQLAYYLAKEQQNIEGVIVANPLASSSGINYMDYTYLTFTLEVVRFRYRLQFINIRNVLPKIKRMTNNNSYEREMAELFQRRYIHGIPLKFIAQCRYLIEFFWNHIEEDIGDNDILFIQTKDDNYQEKKTKIKGCQEFLGNHLVFTDYINDEVVLTTTKWIMAKIK